MAIPPSHVNFRAYIDDVEDAKPPPEATYAASEVRPRVHLAANDCRQ